MYLFYERLKSGIKQVLNRILNNKPFWNVLKALFLMNQLVEIKNLTENGEHLKTELKTAEVLNSFYSNLAMNLKIPQYLNFDPIV